MARYPIHEGCGGPLLPAVAFDHLEDGGGSLFCARCHTRTEGHSGDLGQATMAALVEASSLLFSEPRARRRRPSSPGNSRETPGKASTRRRTEEQLDLFRASRRHAR